MRKLTTLFVAALAVSSVSVKAADSNVFVYDAKYTNDTLTFTGENLVFEELKAENFMIFVDQVSSAADYNKVISVSVSSTTVSSTTVSPTTVSSTVFQSISNTLNALKFAFSVEGNKATFVLAEALPEKGVLVAYNGFVVDAEYVAPVIRPAINTVEAAEFSVYPNPVQDVLYISCEAGVSNVAIFDVAGRMVKASVENSINVSELKSGMYIVKVVDMNGAVGTTRILK